MCEKIRKLLERGDVSPELKAELEKCIDEIDQKTEKRKEAEKKNLKEIAFLKQENIEKDKFFSIIAHDLRSPFNVFLGLSQVLKEDSQTMSVEDLQHIAGAMNESAENIFQLLESLLEWAKVRTNRFVLNLQKTYFGSIALKVRMLTAGLAGAKGINIEEKNSIDSEFKCDWFIVETILRNLVGNAIKFSKTGDKIIIASKMTAKNVEISVSDNGIGMSKEMVGKIFQLNSNTRRPGTAGEKSSGLGLLLCKELVNLHGGEIWVESKEGVGSVFHFTIPLDLSAIPHNQVLVANN